MNNTLAGLSALTQDVEKSIVHGLNGLNLVSFDALGDRIKNCMKIYEDTGDIGPLRALRKEIKNACGDKPNTLVRVRLKESEEEHQSVSESNPPEGIVRGRPRRKAFQEATEKVNKNITYMREDSREVKKECITISDEEEEKIFQKRGAKKKGMTVKTERTSARSTNEEVKVFKVDANNVNPLQKTKRGRPKKTKPNMSLANNEAGTSCRCEEDAWNSQVLEKDVPKNVNETFTITKGGVLNQTVVTQKAINPDQSAVDSVHDFTTDDRSIRNFVKKRVAIFEKLSTATSTPSKTKPKAKAEDGKQAEHDASNRYLSNLRTSANQTNHFGLSNSGAKTLSSTQLSHQQLRDQKILRKAKEAEALKKKEAHLQKQSLEIRQKREEKEQKSKLQRDVLEKEKQRMVEEHQKMKDEKQKELMIEKQERLQMQREEAEKRRMIAKQKAAELKNEQKNHSQVAQQNLPLFMTQKRPPLPRPDCSDSDEHDYDNDDEDEEKQRRRTVVLPAWNSGEAIHASLRTMSYIDAKLRNSWFCVKPQSPNLLEVFPNLDPRMLSRNSSAIWKDPPRFTMIPED